MAPAPAIAAQAPPTGLAANGASPLKKDVTCLPFPP